MNSLSSRLAKLLRIARSKFALASARLRLRAGTLPSDLNLARGVVLAATDGGSVRFGVGTSIDRNATLIAKHGTLNFDAGAYIGIGAIIVCRSSIKVGRNALFAEYVTIRDQDHTIAPTGDKGRVGFTTSPIVIGDNVWLGAKVTVIQGVTIGNNVVVGANSVVTHA
ncbi:MAG: acyltransferase [Burkholderiaceae bacterium]